MPDRREWTVSLVLRPVQVVPALDLERVRDAVAASGAQQEDVAEAAA